MNSKNNANAIKVSHLNIGGRDHIFHKVFNHHKALSNIKPTMKIEKPFQHVDAKRR